MTEPTARPIDVFHDEMMARAKAEHEARTASDRTAASKTRAAVLLEAADFVANHPGPIPYRPQLDEDGGFWWDTRDRDAVAAELRRLAGEDPEGSEPDAVRRETVLYFLECRAEGGGWESPILTLEDLDEANRQLAAYRGEMPHFEYRVARQTTTVVVQPLPESARGAQQGPTQDGEPVCSVAGCGHTELAHTVGGCRDCPRGQRAVHLFSLPAVARSGQPETDEETRRG